MDLAKRYANRAGTRTPMQWNDDKNAGFSTGKEDDLYLPTDPNPERPTVEVQEKDKNSMLNLTRMLIQLKKENPAFNPKSKLELVYAKENTYPLIYKRVSGDNEFLICINPKGEPIEVTIPFENDSSLNEIIIIKVAYNRNGENSIYLKMDETSFGIFKVQK